MAEADRFVSAVADDLSFRVVTARTTDMVRGAVEAQGATGETARRFGELLTGAVLLRVTMAPKLRVQGILHGAGHTGQLVADSHPDGWCRGLVKLREGARDVRVGEGSVLQMMRSLPNGDLHQGMVEVPAEGGGGVAAALMAYMQHSEQVVSTLDVGCVMQGDRVVSAGGYMVQLLPEVPEGSLMVMTERLDHDFRELGPLLESTDAAPDQLLEELLWGIPHATVESAHLRFDCNCSRVRVMTSLATLSRDEIEEMVHEGEPLHITCDYCGSRYTVEVEHLKGLLQTS
ncbi:MAG: Hsp33 family molecular chaperone HslO [Myxococcota bacterium]